MNLDDMLAKALQNPEVKKEYDALEVEYSIKSAMLQARKEPNHRNGMPLPKDYNSPDL